MKKKMYFAVLSIIAVIAGYAVASFAEQKQAAVACRDDQIIVATGLQSATYSNMMGTAIKLTDLICEHNEGTTGGFDNILLMVNGKADAGIAQPDVVESLSNSEPMVKKKVRSLVALHTNAMHIIVLRSGVTYKEKFYSPRKTFIVNNLRDLRGQKIAIIGSSLITGDNVNRILALGMIMVEVNSPDEGLQKLSSGEVMAFIAMGGRPIEWMDKKVDSKFTLAAVSPEDVAKLGSPYYPTKLTYKKQGVVGWPTIGIRNEFYVWDSAGKKGEKYAALRTFFKRNLTDIQETRGAHPAWQDVDSLDSVSWKKFQYAGLKSKKR